jgi:hypothetical protein
LTKPQRCLKFWYFAYVRPMKSDSYFKFAALIPMKAARDLNFLKGG